jgi:putative transposase
MVTPVAKLEAIAHTRKHLGVRSPTNRWGCALAGLSRNVVHYEPTGPDDGAFRQRLRDQAAERRRFGYRRLGYLLSQEGITTKRKKLLRTLERQNFAFAAVADAIGHWAHAD